jgi:carbon-monoxide dehydrogenase medium subunit
MTTVVSPTDLAGALEFLAGERARPVGGGVGLSLVRRETGRPVADTLVSTRKLSESRGIEVTGEGLRIGAAEPLEAVASDPVVGALWTVVAQACGSVATGRIRRSVTIGGNVAAFDDTHDPPVALAAAGARARLMSPAGPRVVEVAALKELRPGELIVDFLLPTPAPGTGSAYEKFLVRGVWEYACVSAAAVVSPKGGTLAIGSVREAPLVLPVDGDVTDVAERAGALARPWSDVRGSAEYKRRMIIEFAGRALRAARRQAEAA